MTLTVSTHGRCPSASGKLIKRSNLLYNKVTFFGDVLFASIFLTHKAGGRSNVEVSIHAAC